MMKFLSILLTLVVGFLSITIANTKKIESNAGVVLQQGQDVSYDICLESKTWETRLEDVLTPAQLWLRGQPGQPPFPAGRIAQHFGDITRDSDQRNPAHRLEFLNG